MRLEGTRKADLAAHAMVMLAGSDRRWKAVELAEQLGTTAGFMPQVLGPLVERGWVRSDPGPTGGYSSVVDLEEISVLDVVEAIDGPTDAGRCVVANRVCNAEVPCALHGAWASARTALVDELASTPLATLSTRGSGI